jgi:hypothetical protein
MQNAGYGCADLYPYLVVTRPVHLHQRPMKSLVFLCPSIGRLRLLAEIGARHASASCKCTNTWVAALRACSHFLICHPVGDQKPGENSVSVQMAHAPRAHPPDENRQGRTRMTWVGMAPRWLAQAHCQSHPSSTEHQRASRMSAPVKIWARLVTVTSTRACRAYHSLHTPAT